MKILINPIGKVHNAIKNRHDMPITGVPSCIEIYDQYKQALYKISKQKYLWILCYLHKAKKKVLVAKPRKSKKLPHISRGVFSIHSPDRPNPISLTKVKLNKRWRNLLEVSNLDVIDGTPLIDIKSCK